MRAQKRGAHKVSCAPRIIDLKDSPEKRLCGIASSVPPRRAAFRSFVKYRSLLPESFRVPLRRCGFRKLSRYSHPNMRAAKNCRAAIQFLPNQCTMTGPNSQRFSPQRSARKIRPRPLFYRRQRYECSVMGSLATWKRKLRFAPPQSVTLPMFSSAAYCSFAFLTIERKKPIR